jgi:cytochrome c556
MPHLYCNSDAELDSEAADTIERQQSDFDSLIATFLDVVNQLYGQCKADLAERDAALAKQEKP